MTPNPKKDQVDLLKRAKEDLRQKKEAEAEQLAKKELSKKRLSPTAGFKLSDIGKEKK